tara:strand:+ start:4390 stop:5157 length:768 start_codon:yes stop_codon:yes gene_type:complete
MRLRPAEILLQSLGITEPDEIDLEVIAWSKGAKVREVPLDGCEARIFGHNDRAIIQVNKNSFPKRKRFSIGHEIGHWTHHKNQVLTCKENDIGCYDRSITNPERVADQFASDLLLPRYIFEPVTRDFTTLNMKTVSALSKIFNVSKTAVALKLLAIEMAPSVIVCHTQKGRKWYRRSRNISEYWHPQKELDVESPAFGLLFGNDPESKYLQRIGADAWFTHRHADRCEIKEQSLKVRDDEIISLLVIEDDKMLEC